MDDGPGRGKIKIVPDHFQVLTSSENSSQTSISSNLQPRIDHSNRAALVAVSGQEVKLEEN